MRLAKFLRSIADTLDPPSKKLNETEQLVMYFKTLRLFLESLTPPKPKPRLDTSKTYQRANNLPKKKK